MIVHCKPLRYINVSNLVSVGEFEFCLAYSSDLSLSLSLSLSLTLKFVNLNQQFVELNGHVNKTVQVGIWPIYILQKKGNKE